MLERTRAGTAHSTDSITLFIFVLLRLILAIRRTIKLCRVIVWVPRRRLPIGADEAPSLLEIRRIVKMLLASLDLGFHATASLLPFSEIGGRLLISSLVGEDLVLVLPPDSFQLLLLQVIGRVVPEVIRSSFELVNSRIFDLLFAISEERLKGWLEGGTLRLAELVRHVRKSDRTSSLG